MPDEVKITCAPMGCLLWLLAIGLLVVLIAITDDLISWLERSIG